MPVVTMCVQDSMCGCGLATGSQVALGTVSFNCRSEALSRHYIQGGKRYTEQVGGRKGNLLLPGHVGGRDEDREHTGANRLTKARGHIR